MTDERPETFAQLIAAIKETYDVTEPKIADDIGVHVSTVNHWISGKRGGKQGPRRQTLEALAAAYPAFPRERIFAAARRVPPAPLDDASEADLVEYFRELTAEQRRMLLTQARAVAEQNRTGQ